MREPGIEPGSRPWQGRSLPLAHSRSITKILGDGF